MAHQPRSARARGRYRGETWYPLASLPGFSARFNPAEQSLQLNFSPSAFATTRIGDPAAERPVVSRPLTTVFANYDLSYTRSDVRGIAATNDVGALTELGVSGSAGVLTNTSVIRNVANDPGAPYTPGWRRLETAFTRDFPERNASLRLGDSTTRTGAWGRSVYFGGIQWATNFSLSPGYITQPIPTIGGQSRAPSTVELYINDALRQTSQVPTGPFTIDNFPQITGSGQARIVVRDLLGRETVLVQDFFSSTSLLRKGLSDYSFEAGAVRRNLGIDSANYGAGFVSGMWRHGLTTTSPWRRGPRRASNCMAAAPGLSRAAARVARSGGRFGEQRQPYRQRPAGAREPRALEPAARIHPASPKRRRASTGRWARTTRRFPIGASGSRATRTARPSSATSAWATPRSTPTTAARSPPTAPTTRSASSRKARDISAQRASTAATRRGVRSA